VSVEYKTTEMIQIAYGEWPPNDAAMLHDETAHRDFRMSRLMGKAAYLDADPFDVARFSGIRDAVALLVDGERAPYWAIRR